MAAAWWRHAIERRLVAVVVMALVLWTVATTAAGLITARRVADTLVEERASRAREIAARIERELEDELRRLDRIAAVLERRGDVMLLRAAIRELRLAEAVLRLAPDGRVEWAREVQHGDEAVPPVPEVHLNGALRWRAQPTGLLDTADGRRALLILPAREADPRGGALAAVLLPDAGVLASLVAAYRDEVFLVLLVDAAGEVMATSRAAEPPDEPLVASVPVPRTPWRVEISQPRREALAPMRALLQVLVGGSLLLMAAALLMAWGAARSIRQPVERLTTAAERLADGGLDAPIAAAGDDEIGRLAQALERLRLALQDDEQRSLLLRRVLAVQEDERRRIARELHDETTQQLTALALQLDTASYRAGTGFERPAPARQLVDTMIDGLHRIIYDLRPSVLDDLGLLAAIRSYATTHLESNGIAVHCEFPADIPPLAPDATTAVYRVVQEALTNVMRHARAEAVQLACAVSDDVLTIEVEDDGIGFDPESVRRPRTTGEGLGLLGMRERLALLGGRLAIDAAPGAGTRVTVTLRLTAAVLAASEVPA